ncbi:MAG: flippase-like domain-containing protein [Elusimicrobiota bacterium]|jgi:uncharacterized protein (TIRG00374 family)|nr:flippase-like domain-containing protein [Elusimicrobiota bacterium]
MKKFFNILFGILISFSFIYIIARKIDLKEVFFHIKNINVTYIILFIITIILSYILKSYRGLFLTFNERISLKKILTFSKGISISMFLNNILPMRSGDLIRAFFISKSYDIKKTFMIGTIVIERIFDILTLLILLSFFLLITTRIDIPLFVRNLSSLGLVIFCLIFFILIYFKKYKGIIIRKFNRLHDIKFFKKLTKFLNSILDGFFVLDKSNHVFRVGIISIFIWLLESFSFFLIGKALYLNLTFLPYIFIMAIVCFGTLLPSGPAFIGVFEGGCIFALAMLGIDAEISMAFAVVFHFLKLGIVSVFGLFFIFKEKIDVIKDLKDLKNQFF